MTPLPFSLQQNPRLNQWLDFSRAGIARIFSAKVELGQGIITALAQIAAEELCLPITQVEVISGDTRYSPDEWYTAGSMSIEVGGMSVRLACAQARQAMLEEAARSLNVGLAQLRVDAGVIVRDGNRSDLDYWKLAPKVNWNAPVTGTAPLIRGSEANFIGRNVARFDLPAKVTGGAFVQDLELPGMLHGRVLRPPSPDMHLIEFDETAAEKLPGVVKVWRSGDFVGVCCEREYQAVKALEVLRATAKWTDDARLPAGHDWKEWLPKQRAVDSHTEVGNATEVHGDLIRVSATYSKPPIAHASLGPSCAVAQFDGTELRVWTHSQGVFPLRSAMAEALKLAPERIIVIHTQGAGCYGHNGADDVALDAALLAIETQPRPVRVQWMREDEFAWAPLGSPSVVKINAAVTPGGELVDWSTEIWSGPHARRPKPRDVELLAATQLESPIPFPHIAEDMTRFAGGSRNSEPQYDLLHRKIVLHSLPDLPFRTSALRTLGGYANVFAMESLIDELAETVGIDPIQFRLRNISDPRARRVIETAARVSKWDANAERGTGRAAGFGFSRYKTTAAYVAVVARVEVDEHVRVHDVFCAVDAGLAINPDGIRNQIEGGLIQGTSWTLLEQIAFTSGGIAARTWEDYPILHFAEVPHVQVELIENPEQPALGVGEAAHGPIAAAIGNAVARALNCRIRDLPITRERIVSALAS